MFIVNLDNTRRLIIYIWVRAISAAESQSLSRFLFLFWSFLSSFILPIYCIYHTNQRAIDAFDDDSPRLILHYICRLSSFIFLFLICYIYPTDHRWLFWQLAKASTAIISVAFRLFPLILLFLSTTYLTPIMGGFSDDSPRLTLPPFLSPFVFSLSCYLVIAVHILPRLWNIMTIWIGDPEGSL